MNRIESILSSSNKLSEETFNHWLWCLYKDYHHNQDTLAVLLNIQRYKKELLGYKGISQAPVTNNIIEGLNSHLERRLVALCSFQTLQHAKLWLNGYFLRRRTKPYTDCEGKFRHLNGKSSLDQSLKNKTQFPTLFKKPGDRF